MKNRYQFAVTTLMSLSLLACGGGGGGNSESAPQAASPVAVSGGAVKGPLAGADVSAYAVDVTASDLKGALLGIGVTADNTAITGLEIPADSGGSLLLEFTVTANTIDITTDAAPPFDRLVTVVDVQRVLDGELIHASLLTTMAVDLARQQADSGLPYAGNGDGTVTVAEFTTALDVAQGQIKATLGFGIASDIDIFTVPPLITSVTDDAQEQADVVAHRQANEIIAALVSQVSEDSSADDNPQQVLEALVEDLTDGNIDGNSDDGAVAVLAALDETIASTLANTDPLTLNVPGTDSLISDIETMLADETEVTEIQTDTTDLEDGTIDLDPGEVDLVSDIDDDGVNDDQDAFPLDPNETTDSDEDGVGDNSDVFPNDPNESADSDGDQVGDNADAFPNDPTLSENPATDGTDGDSSDGGTGGSDDDSNNSGGGGVLIVGTTDGTTIDEFNPVYNPRTAGSHIVVSNASTVVFADDSDQQLAVGDQLRNPANIQGSAAISYISSNTGVAAVDINGLVTAHRVGTTTISASTSSGLESSYELSVVTATSVSVDMWIGVNNAEVNFSDAATGMVYFHTSDIACELFNVLQCSDGAIDTDDGTQILSTAARQDQDSLHGFQSINDVNEAEIGTGRWAGRSSGKLVNFKDRMWMIGGKPVSSNEPVNDIWSSQDGNTWVEQLADAPFEARQGHGVVEFDNKLWVVGGWDSNTSYGDVWSSEDGVNWILVSAAENFGLRYDHALLAHDNKMWLIGGREVTDSGSALSSDVWYTEDGETWVEATAAAGFDPSSLMHSLVFNNQLQIILIKTGGTEIWTSNNGADWQQQEEADFPVVSWSSFTVHDSKVWAAGGSFGGFIDTVWVSEDGFTFSRVSQEEYKGFRARYLAHTVSFNDHLWLMGGNSSVGSLNDVYSTTDGASWRSHNFASELPARYYHSLLSLNGRQYVFGGQEQTRLNSVWSSSDGLHWEEETPNAEFSARSSQAAFVFNNKLWFAGGEQSYIAQSDIWSSADGSTWVEETNSASFGARTEHKIVEWNGQLWMTAGDTDNGAVADVWTSSDGVNWTLVTAAPGFTARYGHGMVVFQDRLWVFGGITVFGNGANDVWSSSDGVNWAQESVSTAFVAGFADRSTVFGGNIVMVDGSETVWMTSNGTVWNSFSTNTGLAADVFGSAINVFDNQLWLQGGTWSAFRGNYNSAVYKSEDGSNWRVGFSRDIEFE